MPDTASQDCRQCGERKTPDAFERLGSGGRRGTCKSCRLAAKNEYRQKQRTSPEYQAEVARREEERAAPRLAMLANKRMQREAAWDAMISRRHQRAILGSVQREPSGFCDIALDGGGFISIAEFALRVKERAEVLRLIRRDNLGDVVMVEERPEDSMELEAA